MVEIVTVTPSGSSDNVQWTLCHNTKCGGTALGTAYPQIDIPQNAKNALVIFSIEGENEITFRQATDPYDASEAFYVEPGKGKNPGKGVKSDGQFENVTLANGKTLVFNDTNSKDIWLSYKLHFQQDGQPVNSIDPDIKNGGSGHGVTQGNFLADQSSGVIIALAVLLFLLGGFVGALIAKRAG